MQTSGPQPAAGLAAPGESGFRSLVELVGEALLLLDGAGHVVYATPRVRDVIGFGPEELRGRDALDFVHAGDLALVRELLGPRLRQPGRAVTARFRGRHRDGRWRQLEGTATNRMDDPALGAVVCTFRDVTDRTRTEDAFRSSEQRFRALVQAAGIVIVGVSVEDCIFEFNREAERVFGWAREEVLGRDYFELLVAPESRAAVEAEFRLAQGGQAVRDTESVARTRGGEPRTLRWNVSRLPAAEEGRDGAGAAGVLAIDQDITDRLRAEAALRRSEARYRTLLENLEQGVFLKDAGSRFLAVNRRFCDNLGVPEEAILGKTDFDFFPRELAEKYRADDHEVLIEGRRLETEEEGVVRGRRCQVRVIKTPVCDEHGEPAAVLGIYWDVTEQRSLEDQLRQAQKMEAVGQLAGGVAHDFNNLLTAILGNLALVQATLAEGHAARPAAGAAERAAWRAAHLTRQLLGFSRRTVLRPEPLDLNATLDEVASLLGRTIDPRNALETVPTAGLWAVLADPNQMNHVLMNLCLNARDALTPLLEPGAAPSLGRRAAAAPRLVLETANVRLEETEVRRRMEARAGEFVRLRVRDNGTGIPPEVMPRIFEPFFTTKGQDRGTGLGLTMVFGIVQQHDGWIECDSAVGRGTCFDLFLPRQNADAPAAVEPHRPAAPRGHETVLLVDDDVGLRNMGRNVLQRQGYRVLVAGDGLQAVELFRRERARIDLVVLDLTMPRLSGRDAFHLLRKIDPAAAVVFASGYNAEQLTHEEHTQSYGFLGKPYRPEDLATAVRAALDRGGRGRPRLALAGGRG
jgi:PAS domain S-box-containing protein